VKLTNSDPSRRHMGFPVMVEFRDDDANDDHRHTHDDRAHDQHWLTADLVDNQHRRNRADDKNHSRDPGCKQSYGSFGQSQALEDVRCIINYGIDT
jgi:hypothetical protein